MNQIQKTIHFGINTVEESKIMYWTLRKNSREIRTHSRFKMIYLRLLGWKLNFRMEGSE